MKLFIFCVLVLACLTKSYRPEYLGQFTVPGGAAFLKVNSFGNFSRPDLFVTTFFVNPFSRGRVSILKNIGEQIRNLPNVKVETVATSLWWPNDLNVVPYQIFGGNYIWVADGFLVPGKSTGGIYIFEKRGDGSFGQPIEVSKKKSGYFYHNVEFIDINKDGKIDILAARASKPIRAPEDGELIWLEHPKEGSWKGQWKEHFIVKGPDVNFVVDKELTSDPNKIHIFSSQFFSKKLTLLELTLQEGEPKIEFMRTIDDTLGSAYAIEIQDLNNKGVKNLLVSNHETKGENGALFAYEFPKNLKEGEFKRHLLSRGYPIRGRGFNEATPGYLYGFHPNLSDKKKPYLLVAGDGSHEAYFYTPQEEDFKYEREVLRLIGGTVGSIAHFDVDGDGYTEAFVPNYESGVVHVYRFK